MTNRFSKIHLLIFGVYFLLFSCSSPEDSTASQQELASESKQINASKSEVMYKINPNVEQYVHSTLSVSKREEMKQLLEKDFQRRIDEGYTNVALYKAKLYVISDIQMFTNDGKRAIFLVSSLFKDKPDGMVKMFTGRLSNETKQWSFSDGGLPNYYYEYNEKVRNKPFTHKELITRTIDKLIRDGLLDSSGKVNQDYLKNNWF